MSENKKCSDAIKIYYRIKPIIPRRFQIFLRGKLVLHKRKVYGDIWPIDAKSSAPPDGWDGWPDGRKFALVLTHDVDTARGQERCRDLVDLEKSLNFRSSFNFVPERYDVSAKLRQYITDEGFEVGVHGLRHDGELYRSEKIFLERATHINRYLKEWGAAGFRSPAMHHNLDWLHALDIEYDASTFDTDPFEPQPDGMSTIYPFYVKGNTHQNGYVELPYTLPQDFTLFILMKEKGIDVWRSKLDWIAENGGMALVNVHPDYTNFGKKRSGIDEYPAEFYREFLEYIRTNYGEEVWHVLPREIARFWSSLSLPDNGTIDEHDISGYHI